MALIHTRLFLTHEGQVHGLTLTIVDDPLHDTHFHTIHQSNPPSFTLFQPPFNTPWHEAIAR